MGAWTTGLGLFSQPREAWRRFSRSRTLVKYWSRRSRSRAVTPRCEFLGLAGDGVEDAAARVELADLRGDLLGGALEEQLLEDTRRPCPRAGWRRRCRSTRDCLVRVLTPRVSDGKRVSDADLLGHVLVQGNRCCETSCCRDAGRR